MAKFKSLYGNSLVVRLSEQTAVQFIRGEFETNDKPTIEALRKCNEVEEIKPTKTNKDETEQ